MERSELKIDKSVFEFVTFFQNRGYEIPSGFYDLYFTVIPALHLETEPISELAPILKTLIVKDEKTERDFDFDFHDFLYNIWPPSKETMKEDIKKRDSLDSYIKKQEKDLSSCKTKKEKQEKKLKKLTCGELRIIPAAKEKLLKKLGESLSEDLEGLFAMVKPSVRKEIQKLDSEATIHELDVRKMPVIQESIQTMMKNAVLLENCKRVLGYLKELYELADTVRKVREDNGDAIEELKKNIEYLSEVQKQTQKQLDDALKEADSYSGKDQLLRKMETISHRDQFQTSGRAVQVIIKDRGEAAFFNKDFNKLTDEEKESIKQYIQENARQFRTRLSRNIRTIHKDKIDIAETCKKACSTNGIPMQLMYQKPTEQRTKLLMFLDVSGSCREASELMLYFMYYMKEIFKGGCKTYAFVNSLYDISGMFDLMDPEQSIKNILEIIPARGVYSNYYVPLKEFYEKHFSDVTKDTLVFFIGDARNNQNNSGVEYVRAIARKCKRFYWMNTENALEWDVNDSIIGTYKPYLDTLFETVNANELLGSLEEIK